MQPEATKLIKADKFKRRLFFVNFMIATAFRECRRSLLVKNKFSIFFD